MLLERTMYQPENQFVRSTDSQKTPVIPTLIFDSKDKDILRAIIYKYQGKKYVLSNEEGHKIIEEGHYVGRPMTKKEFKGICEQIINESSQYGELEAPVLSHLEHLNFALGHANSTFEVVKSYISQAEDYDALVLNLSTSRYLYNKNEDSVFQIDHAKHINGRPLTDPAEKAMVIQKIKTSKTISKKINKLLNS